jgi:hypothetical protein
MAVAPEQCCKKREGPSKEYMSEIRRMGDIHDRASIAHLSIGVNAVVKADRRSRVATKKAATTVKKTKRVQKATTGAVPSQLIDARIKALGDWRGEMLARVRALIKEADPDVVEEVKWRKPSNPMGVPVWEHAGIICTGETYKDKVKLTFARGAALNDPSGLFNSSLDGNVRRAIDFHEGDKIDEKALKALVRAAVALNTST